MTKKRATGGKVTPPGADAAPQVGPELTDDGQLPLYFHCLAVEGMSTSDGRTIAPDGLSHRVLPISVLAQFTNPGSQGGHAGAEVIGHLTEMWRKPGPEVQSLQTGQPFPEGTFVWQGRGVADPDTTGGKLVAKGHLRGNSVDLSDVDYDEEFAEDGKDRINITRGVISATTLCPIPAFADAYVSVTDGEDLSEESDLAALDEAEFERRFDAAPTDEPDRLGDYLAEGLRRLGVEVAGTSQSVRAALTAAALPTDYALFTLPTFRSAELGDECGTCLAADANAEADWVQDASGAFAPTADKRRRAFARGLAMKGSKPDGSDASYPIENQDDADKAAGMVGLGNKANPAIKAHIAKCVRKLGLKMPASLTAAGGITLPPLSIFSDPGFTEYVPLTVGQPREDGRREISGHIAQWNECHVGISNTCTRAPHSRTDYARFATGGARCVDENGQARIAAVGPIVMSRSTGQGGHAPKDLSEADTVAFYDNHCSAAAHVAVGEDSVGIWVHGLTVPDLSEADVDRLLAAPPSGDWRGYRGNLELVAVLAVNTPGYVVPRSRVASGEPVSLVAAGREQASAGVRTDRGAAEDLRAVIREELVAAGLRTPEQVRQDGGIGDTAVSDTTVVPLAGRKAAALLAIRKASALEAVNGPFDARTTETSM